MQDAVPHQSETKPTVPPIPEPVADDSMEGVLGSVVDHLEQATTRAGTFMRENPGLCLLGALSVGALAYYAVKKGGPRHRGLRDLERSVRRLVSEQSGKGADLADGLSQMLTHASAMEPKQVAAYRQSLGEIVEAVRRNLASWRPQ